VKKIPLTRGKVALVDDADYERISKFRWCAVKASRTFYAQRKVGGRANPTTIFMHHAVMGTKRLWDHRNRNGLDNRRCNLRRAKWWQNCHNKLGAAGCKGVYRKRSRWRAEIRVNRQRHYLGTFNTQPEAALAYNQAARRLVGSFAVMNTHAARRITKLSPPRFGRRLNSSGFRGVHKYKYRPGCFQAQISKGGRQHHLGVFDNAEAAARAYNGMARRFFGERALLNQV
jgi:hypothetical protein